MTTDFEARVLRLEDRIAISECVINYARAVDAPDWELYASCITETVHIDFSQAGLPAQDFPRDELVAFARGGLSGYDARQHLSPNHLVTFDEADDDRAVCESYMVAQHHIADAEGGDVFVMRGSYTNRMRRTPDGWRIEHLTQHLSWNEGNEALPSQAMSRVQTNTGSAA